MIASMTFEEWMEQVVRGIRGGRGRALVAGSVLAFVRFAVPCPGVRAYEGARQGVGRAILLGLEILIIADIVQTITIDPTLESAIALGAIALVRTFLSFSLEIQLEGVVPWRRSAVQIDRGSVRTSGSG